MVHYKVWECKVPSLAIRGLISLFSHLLTRVSFFSQLVPKIGFVYPADLLPFTLCFFGTLFLGIEYDGGMVLGAGPLRPCSLAAKLLNFYPCACALPCNRDGIMFAVALNVLMLLLRFAWWADLAWRGVVCCKRRSFCHSIQAQDRAPCVRLAVGPLCARARHRRRLRPVFSGRHYHFPPEPGVRGGRARSRQSSRLSLPSPLPPSPNSKPGVSGELEHEEGSADGS